MTTKKQQNGDQIATSSLGDGYLAVNKRLIECLLKENVGCDYIVGYITLLALARHQDECTEQGICHAEVFVTVPDLRKLLGMDENRMRNFIYWLENKDWATKRLINGRRVILLTKYDEHTCLTRKKTRKPKATVEEVYSVSKFADEKPWD